MSSRDALVQPTPLSATDAAPPADPPRSTTLGKRSAPKRSPQPTPSTPALSSAELTAARTRLMRLRDLACEQARPLVASGGAPIRVMAGMVARLEADCREHSIPAEVVAAEVVNRTIGDIDVRRISARDDGPRFVTLADEMGLALPGEIIDGYRATGKRYRWIRARMQHYERALLARHFDLRIYDLPATGNPYLREMLGEYARRQWEISFPPSQIHLSLGSLDGLNKFFQGFAATTRQGSNHSVGIIFPAPGFNVPEWQAHSFGLRVHRITTLPEQSFKVRPAQILRALEEAPDIRALYLTVSNNPTAFAYSPAELDELFDTLLAADREVLILADLAYIGTADVEQDRARMRTFTRPEVLARSVLFNSFSKSYTLTGDRLGWVGFGSPELAASVIPGWANSMASLPADWQLRYMACIELFSEHPEIGERVRALYRHRRGRLIRQLQSVNEQHALFAHIHLDDGGTVYNWSQLKPEQDVFSLFSRTGIAGVPGGAFGYTDDFVRFSVGCIPVPDLDAR